MTVWLRFGTPRGTCSQWKSPPWACKNLPGASAARNAREPVNPETSMIALERQMKTKPTPRSGRAAGSAIQGVAVLLLTSLASHAQEVLPEWNGNAIKILGARLNGQKLSLTTPAEGEQPELSIPTLRVAAGESIQGEVELMVSNGMHAGAVAPVAATVTFGDPRRSFWTVAWSTAVGDQRHSARVDLRAPTKPGRWHLLFAMSGSYNVEQIASGTHPGMQASWDKGSLLARIPAEKLESAGKTGWITHPLWHADGMRMSILALATMCIEVTPAAPVSKTSTLICIDHESANSDAWHHVADTLQRRHNARLFVGDVHTSLGREAIRTMLRAAAPDVLIVVAPHDTITRNMVAFWHKATRAINADPFGDCLWGIVTGLDAQDALRSANGPAEINVKRLLAGTGTPDDFVEGITFSEGEAGVRRVKQRGKETVTLSGRGDGTLDFALEFSHGQPDAIITSGHATERDWQMGFRFPGGQIVSDEGVLNARAPDGVTARILSSHPKVWLAAGNCLIGHVVPRDSVALASMFSAGVHQFAGYNVVTWRGFMGWKTRELWVESQGRLSLAESAYIANQLCIAELVEADPQLAAATFDDALREDPERFLRVMHERFPHASQELLGNLWDRDAFVFYGDPHCRALVERGTDLWPSVLVRRHPEAKGATVQVELHIRAKKAVRMSTALTAMLPHDMIARPVPGAEGVICTRRAVLLTPSFNPLDYASGEERMIYWIEEPALSK